MSHPTHFQFKPVADQYCLDGWFECPCCSFMTKEKFSFSIHLENHISHAVEHGGYFISKCNKLCRTTAHFHCLYCSQTVIRKEQYISHVSKCSKTEVLAAPTLSPALSVAACPTPCPPATVVTKAPVSTPLSSDPGSFVPFPPPQIQRKRVISLVSNSLTSDPGSFAPPPPKIQKKTNTVMCPHCGLLLNRRNVRLHILRRHTPIETDISALNHLKSQCVDYRNGVYAVAKAFSAPNTPIHIIRKTWGSEQRTTCELDICRINTEFAERSNIRSYECHHLRSLAYCPPAGREISLLTEQGLQTMVDDRWFGKDKKERCLARQREAIDAGVPLSCLVTVCGPSHKKYISVFEPTISYYSRLGRVMVTYDAKTISWHCPCAKPRQSCLHKNVAKWHLFEVDRALFRKTRSVEEDSIAQHFPTNVEGFEAEEGAQYPPEGQNLSRMVRYIFDKKKLPAVIPSDVLNSCNFPLSFTPSEAFCTECSEVIPLSEPLIITSKAKILTMTNVIEGISMYRKQCYRCGMVYRYQEWCDGIYNFDDHILLSIHLCHFHANSLQTHQAVGSAIEVLERTSGKAFPSKTRILHAYLSFEALSDHTYTFACVTCGYHPVSVVMDLHKKGVFSMPVSSIEEPPEDFDGKVNAEDFWERVSLEMISRGLVPNNEANPFVVRPSYHNWAPWIGPHTRSGNHLLNTEYQKVHSPYSVKEESEFTLTEDRLTDELLKLKIEAVRSLCRECGIDPKGSRMDLVGRLQQEMKNRASYDKVFSQIWGASGGWAVVTCPCAVVYGVKFNIRAESPRDFTDLLFSMKHFPNISLYDFARGLATHTNIRKPETFHPHGGRLLEPTEENIQLANSGQIKVNLPWLLTEKSVPDVNGHPITGSSDHYALYDRFHEANSKDARDTLRKVELVPELCGWLNSQCAEQLFSGMRKNNHFLNMMTPSSHIFLMRNILHHNNINKNSRTIENMKTRLGMGLDIVLNSNGQTVLGAAMAVNSQSFSFDTAATVSAESVPSPASPAAPSPAFPAAPSPASTAAPSPASPTAPSPASLGFSGLSKPWEKELNPIQDKLLSYVLDTSRPGAEIIIKEGPTCLTREEFWSLGLQRYMDSQIGNACFKLIHEAAQQHGKDIYIENMYVVPTWKHTPNNVVGNFPKSCTKI
ncbi:uncharacterized protein LOC127661315 [Xyrauchen texanus]|uniref:uncharacterized protein LOC127661315 n=1 Tax=Xyrauchen texanus TaxID=154827 RepID=UPI002242C1E6|nr:uncharacterized protein LOC127661315 [Xyrauchen texanus]